MKLTLFVVAFGQPRPLHKHIIDNMVLAKYCHYVFLTDGEASWSKLMGDAENIKLINTTPEQIFNQAAQLFDCQDAHQFMERYGHRFFNTIDGWTVCGLRPLFSKIFQDDCVDVPWWGWMDYDVFFDPKALKEHLEHSDSQGLLFSHNDSVWEHFKILSTQFDVLGYYKQLLDDQSNQSTAPMEAQLSYFLRQELNFGDISSKQTAAHWKYTDAMKIDNQVGIWRSADGALKAQNGNDCLFFIADTQVRFFSPEQISEIELVMRVQSKFLFDYFPLEKSNKVMNYSRRHSVSNSAHDVKQSHISLYTVYHKPAHVLQSEIIKPIKVGAGEEITGVKLSDSEGDNIVHKNSYINELTAVYWAWKNDKQSDYIGLMHYRRFFDFNVGEERYTDKYGLLQEDKFSLFFQQQFGLLDEDIQSVVADNDIILPEIWDVKNLGFKTLYDHYARSEYHHIDDLLTAKKVMSKYSPEYVKYFEQMMESSCSYLTNMFVFRREIFDAYCNWLFGFIEELELEIDTTGYTPQEARAVGYIAERMLTVWVLKYLDDNPRSKVKYLRRVFVKDTSPKNYYAPLPVTQKDIVSVTFASDDVFVPHLGALLVSVAEHFDFDKNFLDIIILDGGISHRNQHLLRLLLSKYDCSMAFLDMADQFAGVATHMHFSPQTFYRLMLPDVLLNRDKVLYIDCDTIVVDDISTLFHTDIHNAPLAAVFDYVMHNFCNTGVRSMAETGGIPSKEYLAKYVGLKNNWDKYFQAGVILFNLQRFREDKVVESLLNELITKKYWFLDQDVLNKFYLNEVVYLDSKWNVLNCYEDIVKGLPTESASRLLKSAQNPSIMHYAGFEAKPWNTKDAKFAEIYWYYLRKTYWYEQVVKPHEIERMKTVMSDFQGNVSPQIIHHIHEAQKSNVATGNQPALLPVAFDSHQQPLTQDVRQRKRQKFEENPYRFFADSKYRSLRWLRVFYKQRM